MKLFKFVHSHVRNEERVHETILFETDSYNSATEESCEGFFLGQFYTNSSRISSGQYDFLRQIFEEETIEQVDNVLRLPGARFAITEARIITIV